MLTTGCYRKHVAALLTVLVCLCSCRDELPEGKIAFWVASQLQLYILDLNDRKMERTDIGLEEVEIMGMGYSRRANLLVFDAAEHKDIPCIYVYDLSTKQVHLLYQPTSYEEMRYEPRFHPNGKWVFSLNADTGIFVHDVATRQWEKVGITGTEATRFRELSFSRTGRSVALRPIDECGLLIGKLANNKNEIVIETPILDDFAHLDSPNWIGDDEIVFAGRHPSEPNYLWKFSLSDQSLVQLTPVHFNPSPCVSPDGKWVVFNAAVGPEAYKAGRSGLWIMSIDGQIHHQVTVERDSFPGHFALAWIG